MHSQHGSAELIPELLEENAQTQLFNMYSAKGAPIMVHALIGLVMLISVYVNGGWINLSAYPDLIVFSVTSTSQVGTLHTRVEGAHSTPLNVTGHPTNFTVSGDCRLVLSTHKDNINGVHMRITDLQDGQFSTVQTVKAFFGNTKISQLLYPAFGPDNTSYAVLAIEPGKKTLYVSDGKNSALPYYSWPSESLVYDFRWSGDHMVSMRVVFPSSEAIGYWRFDLSSPEDNGEYLPMSISEDVYKSLPQSETPFWEETMTPSIAKALACTPYKG